MDGGKKKKEKKKEGTNVKVTNEGRKEQSANQYKSSLYWRTSFCPSSSLSSFSLSFLSSSSQSSNFPPSRERKREMKHRHREWRWRRHSGRREEEDEDETYIHSSCGYISTSPQWGDQEEKERWREKRKEKDEEKRKKRHGIHVARLVINLDQTIFSSLSFFSLSHHSFFSLFYLKFLLSFPSHFFSFSFRFKEMNPVQLIFLPPFHFQ